MYYWRLLQYDHRLLQAYQYRYRYLPEMQRFFGHGR